MEPGLVLVTILCLCVSLHSLFNLFFHAKRLPPGPPTVPILGNLLWLLKFSKNFSSIEPLLRQLRAKYGPVVTLYLGSRPSIFITTHEAAHRALVQTGSLFASRPPALTTSSIFFSNQHTVSTAPYGALWRLLRRNFMSRIHPSRLHLYSHGRKWALSVLKNKLMADVDQSSNNTGIVVVVGHFQHAMFCLLVCMCFGEKLEDNVIREIEAVQRASLTNFIRFNVFNFIPKLGKVLFPSLWKQLLEIRRNQENVLLPLIKARQEEHKCDMNRASYVDSLLHLRIPDSGREFSDGELVSLCSEFINGGTDTSTTTLQWVMANLVKQQEIQKKLLKEINSVTEEGREIEEEYLKKMPYLKAVILETLRRHPPGHFILPRAVTEEIKFNGYDIPKNAIVNFTVAEMGWDPKVWEDPMEFKPERFMNNNGEEKEEEEVILFDIKGIREIKMMPFGAGRRVCPAISMALLHLEYFVANLVRDFEWNDENGCGEGVDLSEIQEFTMVMKNPLKVRITPRRQIT
ncbi:cytochrome P450 89A2 [Ricinus communis]|uniref:Cytochrome P450, putative n=1 Tax=Ricinus communis TaxID=3988 RepID=B9S1M4_RICCO|nr:cytochrome P450 89A2 [Ricinus communis]EEF42493.1 cytochrome P450, putative [Ricinus communis]|eukprot:XP_002519889.1 cytochrome P450 89A2 [Ricinus communis]